MSGIDYKEASSPVVKASSIRLILSLATMHQWPMHQLDVANAFLHGHLDEDFYMAQPQGLLIMLLHHLHSLHFISSKVDTLQFIYRQGTHVVFILVYDDDIIVTSSYSSLATKFISHLQLEFPIRDMG